MARDDTARLREKIAAGGERLATAEREERGLLARAKRERARAEALERKGEKEKAAKAAESARKLEQRHGAALGRLNHLAVDLDQLRAGFLGRRPDPADAIKLLEPEQPIALLPVRLETRYVQASGGGAELLVRLYPDELQSDSHEPELTASELDWGRDFAAESQAADGDSDALGRAWLKLSARFGPRRAAWIAAVCAPLDDDGNPTAAPSSIPQRGTSWSRAARAGALPDRWAVLAYQDGTHVLTAWGEPIADPLAVGPSPAVQVQDPGPDKLPLDDGMRWMVEFDEAVKRGMGVRIPITAQQERVGFDLLLAVGVKPSIDSTAGAGRLESLLNAHHYTDGLGLAAAGSATNNTSEQPGGAAADPYEEQSFAIERGPSDARTVTDGGRLASALGVDGSVLGRMAGASGVETARAAAMKVALWPGTWGYYLDQMMAETFSEAAIAYGREHFLKHVWSNGPFSSLRIGRQPYGVLPVTSLDRWVPAEGGQYDHQIVRMASALRDIWRASLANVPGIDGSADVDRELVRLLSTEAVSGTYSARPLLGREYMRNMQAFLGDPNADDWWTAEQAIARGELAARGLPWDPRLAHAAFSPDERVLTGPLVDEPPPAGAAKVRAHDYMKILTAPTLKHSELHSETYGGDDYRYRALLYLLLRHSLLVEYQSIAWAILVREGLATRSQRREPELIDLLPTATDTIWRVLERQIPLTKPQTIGDYLDDFQTARKDAAAAGLAQWRAAVRSLAPLPADELARLMSGTLDLAAHRLDAWITSFAHRRLLWLRSQPGQSSGVQIGGYGWLEDVRRSAATRTAVTPPAGEVGSPIYEVEGNAGYIHAPSSGQATAAAILRSGHLSNGGPGGTPFAIDLSSERVRAALDLFDGVREGQTLGALLGYRFERGLHENHPGPNLDKHIATFRELDPLVAGKLIPTGGKSLETIAANNVVDGAKLLERSKRSGNAGIPWGTRGLPTATPGNAEYEAITAELAALADAVDAMSDAATAESVYQLARGNHERAGAVMDAINRGELPPPELQVVETPRSGIGLTHRVAIFLDGLFTAGSNWPAAGRQRPRALAEPRLNAWLENALGDPAQVRCRAGWCDDSGVALAGFGATTVRLDELALCALDVIELSLAGSDAQRSELEQRVAAAVMAMSLPANLPTDARLSISFARDASLAAGQLSFGELLESAGTLRALIADARTLDRRDLEQPGRTNDPSFEVAELAGRVQQTLDDLRAAASDTRLASTDPADLTAVLWRLADFGMPQALPSPWATTAELAAQVDLAVKEAGRRLDAAADLADGLTPPPADHVQVQIHVDRMKTAFGGGLPPVALFTVDPQTQLDSAFGDSTSLQGGDAREADGWLTRAARVRAALRRLDAALMYAQALDAPLERNLGVAQLPYEQNDRWLALPFTAAQPMRGGRVSIVAQLPAGALSGPLSGSASMSGLLVDEWVEVVPTAGETTGLAFNFDAPAAQAPQAILLAVSPDPGRQWDLGTLEAILLETFELTKLRAVDPDSLGKGGQFLPTLLFAFNAATDAVSTDFRRSVSA